MPKWSQGYTTEINYVKNAFNELSPAFINFCLTLSGQATPNLTKPFTYAELGAGFGLSVASWAAQYPQAQFFSVDFNPSQTAWTQKLADKAGLDNLKVYERSFHQMLSEDLPQLDYITLHGIYSWVTAEVRNDIREFIVKFLKPGGIVYLSYNAQPGWSLAGPLRNLIMTGAKATGETNPIKAISQGMNFLKELQDSGALYFKAAVTSGNWLETWKHSDPNYLVGELFHEEHRAFYFTEIMDDMGEAKTAYAASGSIVNYLGGLIPADFQARLKQVSGSQPLQETVLDLLYNTAFRRDLFMKGLNTMHRSEVEKVLKKFKFVLKGFKKEVPEKCTLRGAEFSPKPELYNPVLRILSEGPASIEEIREKVSGEIPQVIELLTVLMALNMVQLVPPADISERQQRVKRLNLALDELLGTEVFSGVLAVNGDWQYYNPLERLYILAIIQGKDPETFICDTVKERGWNVQNDKGQEVSGDENVHKLLKENTKKAEKDIPGILKSLGLS